MGEIELVIKIPKEQYSLIMQSHRSGVARYVDKEGMMYAIKNGIPLPKGHGKIGDVDKLNNTFNETCKDFNIDNINFMSVMDMNFYLADTIIEADAESEG